MQFIFQKEVMKVANLQFQKAAGDANNVASSKCRLPTYNSKR